MAILPGSGTTGSRPRDTHPDFAGDDERVPLTAASSSPLTNLQEPLGSMERPAPRSSENDLNIPRDGRRERVDLASAGRGSRSFTATFAIAAAVLLAAFLIALWLGSNRTDVATAPAGDTTGSTTAPLQQTAPGTGDAGTGAGTPAPASP